MEGRGVDAKTFYDLLLINLLSSFIKYDGIDRFKDDSDIKSYRPVFNIIQVVFQFFQGIFNILSIIVFDLGPARDPRSDQMP